MGPNDITLGFGGGGSGLLSLKLSLRASSPIWASEASLARSRETRFTRPNRRACSQAKLQSDKRRFLCFVSLRSRHKSHELLCTESGLFNC